MAARKETVLTAILTLKCVIWKWITSLLEAKAVRTTLITYKCFVAVVTASRAIVVWRTFGNDFAWLLNLSTGGPSNQQHSFT